MARSFVALLLFACSLQASAEHEFPQLIVRQGVGVSTPTPVLQKRQFSNSTVTSTSLDADNSPDPTPDSSSTTPIYIAPTTTLSGAAETTAAQDIGPVIWG